jgi:hypothetical protein
MNIDGVSVFISSRFEEFSSLREKISKDAFKGLEELDIKINMLDHRDGVADSRSPSTASIEDAKNSDIFILIMGETYGSNLKDNIKSFTHLEYETALGQGMKILAFPVGDCYNPANEKLSDNPLFKYWQESVLRNEIHITAPYTPTEYDVDELYAKIYTSLKELIKQSIKVSFTDKDHICPFDSKLLYKQQNQVFQEISFYLMKEKRNNKVSDLPVILLVDGMIEISDEISDTIDINQINDYFINELKDKCRKTIWNNPTYRLIKIDDGKLILGESDYYKTLSTCDIHYYNMIRKNNHFLKKSSDYNQWLSRLKDIVENNNFSNISASLGCSTLLVVKNHLNNKFQYYIVNNSAKKNGNNTKHVIPAFMYQPTKMYADEDDFILQSDLLFQVLKEFGEELLGMEELEHINDYQELYYKMDSNQVIKSVKKLLKNKKAHFKILGLSLDVYRLRPEILTLLVIDDKKFAKLFSQKRKLSWEASTKNMNGLHIVNLEDEEKYSDLMTSADEPLVPPALACLKLGREYMLKHYRGYI